MSIRENALAHIPGYLDNEKIAASLRNRMNEIPNLHLAEARSNLTEEIRQAIINDTELPVDTAHAYIALEHQARAIDIIDEELRTLRSKTRNQIDHLRTSQTKALFAYLNTELEKLVNEVDDLSRKLGGARTAEDAIKHGSTTAIDAWNQIDALTDRYNEIRNTQKEFTQPVITLNFNEVFYSIGLYRDAIDKSTYWAERRRDAYRTSASTGHTHLTWLRKPTPTAGTFDSHNSWWPTEGVGAASLLRVLLEAEPWVPDPHTLQKAHAAAVQAVLPVRDVHGPSTAHNSADRLAHALRTYTAIAHGEEPEEFTPNQAMDSHNKAAKAIRKRLAAASANADYDEQRAAFRRSQEASRRG